MASELPKRLLQPGRHPRVRQINNKCTMATLTKLETYLPTEMNAIKGDPVFGPILKIPDNGLHYSARLIHSFLCRQLATDKKREMWFVFARRPLRFSLQEFHAVTGLKVAYDEDEDEDVDLESWDDDDGFWSRLLRREENISLEKIYKEYITVANRWTREDRQRLAYICVIAGLVMAKGDTAPIPRLWIILAMDMRKLHSYRWGVAAYSLLVESLMKVRQKFLTVEESKRKDTYVLEGFSYAFQIWIMEAIPVLGMLLGKKLNDGIDGPRCSNWTGSSKVSYEQIDQLEEFFIVQDDIYPFISITGNADVVQDSDCVYAKEYADARVDKMTLLCMRNHDWSDHVWEVEDIPGASPPVNESPAEEPNEDGQNASGSTTATRKRKLPDEGAEERKRRLLFDRAGAKQGQCNEEMIKFLKEMFEASFSSWEARLWTKIDGRLSNMEKDMTEMKDAVNAFAATTSTDAPPVKPSETPSEPPSEIPSEPKPVNTAKPKRLDEGFDSNLGTQEYLKKSMDGLSQHSYVADVDPSQNLKPKEAVHWKTPLTSFKSARGNISEPQSSNIDDPLDWLPPPPTSNKEPPASASQAASLRSTLTTMKSAVGDILQQRSSNIDESLDWLPPPPTANKKVPASQAKSKGKSNVKTAFNIPHLSDSPVRTPESANDRLCDISDSDFQKLTAWQTHPTELQIGPFKFDVAMADRIVARNSWLRNNEIDATMFLFRERTSLRRWEPNRVGFMTCEFGNAIHAAHQRYLADKKAFKLDQVLLMYGKGELPSHGRTNQVWGVDVDLLYIPLFVNQNHWIAMRVSFLERKIWVYDCGGGKNRRHADKFAFLIPRIVKAVQPTGNQLSIQQYSIEDVTVRRRLNKNNSDCGVYTLKFIECSVLGLDMGDIDDMSMAGARLRIAYDLWTAAQDPEFIERMSKYESPKFDPGPVVELD